MYKISLEESELIESYTILMYGRTTLRGIYNKGLEKMDGTRNFLNITIKKPRAYQIEHSLLDTVSRLGSTQTNYNP